MSENETKHAHGPTIRRLSSAEAPKRYRIEGGDLDSKWAASLRPGRTAWCEFTVWPDGNIGAYGGEVWPLAWPELFAATPNTIYGTGGVTLTDAGLALIAKAEGSR